MALTVEQIEEAAKYIFDNSRLPDTERRIILRQSCKTNGTLVLDSQEIFTKFCGDPECHNCRNLVRMFKEEVLKRNLSRPWLNLDLDLKFKPANTGGFPSAVNKKPR